MALPWTTHALLMGYLWAANGLPQKNMGYPWDAHGMPMGYVLRIHGLTMGWATQATYGLSISYPWATLMDYL